VARFRTRARAVDLLGKQQIRDEVTAISELLRNSYDADANEGLVDVNTNLGRIIIWDDGEGMDEEDIQNNWLTLGTHSKSSKNNIRTIKGRIKIGEKGIGRLAISILGDQLLLISKKKKSGKWGVLYLHWELFRNENIFLEDIQVPTRSFSNADELIGFLQKNFTILKEELLSNFTASNSGNWTEDKVSRISNEIKQFSISNEIIQKIKITERKGSGTLFYISSLVDNWDWDIYAIKKDNLDNISRRRRRRLEDLLYSFQNMFELFEKNLTTKNNTENSSKDNFIPVIIVNGKNLKDQTWFNEEDLELYDYAIKGTIENGKFSGKLYIRYNNGFIEEFQRDNIDLTEGIKDPKNNNCGPLRINWFFVEGKQNKSSLSKDQHKNITEKLNDIGGIYVFRDGLRILPYGELGNDFLELEERRTKNLRYLFSHRRMFGYIEISKERNPNLIDKSSREGFVENQYYHYFKEISINLLKWWAIDFLETPNAEGRRSLRLQLLEEENKRRMKLKQEEEEERRYLNNIQKKIEVFPHYLNNKRNQIEIILNSILKEAQELSNQKNITYSKLNSIFFGKQSEAHIAIEELNELLIKPEQRYDLDISLKMEIDACNKELLETKNILISSFNDQLNIIKDSILKEIEERKTNVSNSAEAKRESLDKQITEILDQYECIIPNKLKNIRAIHEQKILDIIDDLKRKIIEQKEKYLKYVDNKLQTVWDEYKDLKQNIYDLQQRREQLYSLEFYFDTKSMISTTENLLLSIEDKLNHIHNNFSNLSNKLANSTELNKTNEFLEFLKRLLENPPEDLHSDDKLIGLLKREVNMYRDISAVGLAAELTSHEFNSLYHTIKEDLNKLNIALRTTGLISIVEKVQNAFLSLEKLHQRMSPLYRQSRTKRKEIQLKTFIENAIEYFASDLKRYKIKTIIDIPDSFIVKEAEPVLFTPIINLISNAIYWLINQETKEIHFYSDRTNQCLYVHDTGPGVEEKDALLIFEPYFTKKLNGRGLGLYLSRDLLESKKHELYLVPPNETIKALSGACFCIEFHNNSIVKEGDMQ
jgi:signal transduction histidine kinase